MLDQPGMAVLIDCWRRPRQPWMSWWPDRHDQCSQQEYTDCVNRIVEFCTNNEFVQAVALATKSAGAFSKISNDPAWLAVGKQLFYDRVGKFHLLRTMWHDNTVSWLSYTNPVIANMKLTNNQVGFAVFNALQLAYYCNHVNPAIKNIWICGFSWDICIKNSSVGWLELSGMINANMFQQPPNILVDLRCVSGVPRSSDYVPDAELWHPVTHNIFKLNLEAARLL